MSKRIVIVVGLLVIGAVAMLGTEAMGQGGYAFCFGCGSGDKCQATFKQGGLFTGSDVKNGLVTLDCNTRDLAPGGGQGQIKVGSAICRNPAGMLSTGKSFVGNEAGTFDQEEILTSGDIHGGTATPTNDIPTSVTEFCGLQVLPEICTSQGITDCYVCFKTYFQLPSECIGCPNCNWTYDSIHYDDICVNFKVTVDQDVVLNQTARCQNPGNINFVNCPVDTGTNCPAIP